MLPENNYRMECLQMQLINARRCTKSAFVSALSIKISHMETPMTCQYNLWSISLQRKEH